MIAVDAATDHGVEVRYLGDLQRLQLKPGDRLVLTCRDRISMETCERLRGYFEQWASGVQVLILTEGMTLGAVGVD